MSPVAASSIPSLTVPASCYSGSAEYRYASSQQFLGALLLTTYSYFVYSICGTPLLSSRDRLVAAIACSQCV
ncbi:hypothetical protein CALCODRAFT_489791 [Calocera cornea HHB12733]|uniref:Uncharacterized protein n=1 Tax=Calocera cornea HHB12733 TaxID=1353952 RepID=A0A165JYG6_9BASI|nr:hypothetical protein CALCODRAFT_489791 [Calocera cornea HHB12733]